MTHLTLAGVSADRRRLLLVDDQGVEHTLDINPALRAALRGDASRLGQLEIKMDSALRPRDIQTRIRAGEAPESVAEAAGTTVEAIAPFVGPVLAERQHVADRAQRSNVRRSGGDTGPVRTLGDAVAAHLRSANIDPETVQWDAWRREDGRWTLSADFAVAARTGAARFTFDAPGNYVVLDNEDARWIVGERATRTTTPEPRDDLERARRRRMSSLSEEPLPLGDDAIELVSEPTAQTTAQATAETTEGPASSPEEPAARAPGTAAERVADPTADRDADRADTATADAGPEEAPARRPVPKKKGRASVPSWDEIMFGGGDQ